VGKNIKVMIVEDEAISGIFLKKTLELDDFQVSEIAPSYSKALRIFQSDNPDVVLMDIRLAGGPNGIETAKAILKENPNTPIIFMTGYDEDVVRSQALSLNPLGYLVKPFSKDKVIEMINDYFRINKANEKN
jgi:YesN/AraC family two-component response regulator